MYACMLCWWIHGWALGLSHPKILRKGNAQDFILYGGVSPMKKKVNYAEQVVCSNSKLQQELEKGNLLLKGDRKVGSLKLMKVYI
jgi:hypothetical protein